MTRIRNKKLAWEDRSRYQQKKSAIKIKNALQKHKLHLGGHFTTHDVIDGTSWADIYFLSNIHKNLIYNGTVDSAIYSYFEKCESLAWEASEKMLRHDLDLADIFEKNEQGTTVLAGPKQKTIDDERRAFDGFTRYEWIDAEKLRLADSGDVWVSPEVRLDFTYSFGVGLMATLPTANLSIDIVEAFVQDFKSHGEKAFVSTAKLSFPSDRAKEASAVNSLCDDPSLWAPSAAEKNLALQEKKELSQVIETERPEQVQTKKNSL